MFFEFQNAFFKTWLQLAESSTKLLVESATEFNRASSSAWMEACGLQRPATPLFPFSIPGFPGMSGSNSLNPLSLFQSQTNPLANVWGQTSPFAAFFAPQPPALAAWSAILPWAGMMMAASPFGQQPTIADVMGASFRTASGHAAAAAVAPFTSHTVPAVWWAQPAGRGWLN